MTTLGAPFADESAPLSQLCTGQGSDELSLVAELARMTAYFQLRTIATHMGADPDAVDPNALSLSVHQSTLGEATC